MESITSGKLAALGVSADVPLVVSDDVGARKPDPIAFDALRRALGPADQYWFVGDDPVGDIEGARRSGFCTIWFDEGRPWPKFLLPANLRVQSLTEIADFIETNTDLI